MVIIFKPFLGGKFNPNYEEMGVDLIHASIEDYYEPTKLIINEIGDDKNSPVVMVIDYLNQYTLIDFDRIDINFMNIIFKDSEAVSVNYIRAGIKKYLRDRNIKSLLG
jgi:hypothetical protein